MKRMRIVPAGILTLCLVLIPWTTRASDDTAAAAVGVPSASAPAGSNAEPRLAEVEHQRLRNMVESQAEELRATREQLERLQQRMEALEEQLLDKRSGAIALPVTAVGSTGSHLEATGSIESNPNHGTDTLSASIAAPTSAKNEPQTAAQDQRSDSIQL